jgi:hypothetical protein
VEDEKKKREERANAKSPAKKPNQVDSNRPGKFTKSVFRCLILILAAVEEKKKMQDFKKKGAHAGTPATEQEQMNQQGHQEKGRRSVSLLYSFLTIIIMGQLWRMG